MGSEVARVKISIPPNPSHLEAVNAVVQVGFDLASPSPIPALTQSLESPSTCYCWMTLTMAQSSRLELIVHILIIGLHLGLGTRDFRHTVSRHC